MLTWTRHLRDLEAPGVLHDVARRRASRDGELILLSTGPDENSLAMVCNAAIMWARLGWLRHTLLLADSLETCERADQLMDEAALSQTAEVISISISPVVPYVAPASLRGGSITSIDSSPSSSALAHHTSHPLSPGFHSPCQTDGDDGDG